MMPLWTTASLGNDADGRWFPSACHASPSAYGRCRSPRQAAPPQACLQVLQLASGSPPLQLAVLERRHAGGIVAAYSSRFSASTIEPATGPVPRIPTIPHIRKSLPEIDPATASLRATTGSLTSHVRRRNVKGAGGNAALEVIYNLALATV